jgi:transposase
MTTVWARRGSRPTTVRQTQYDYLWVIAAACPSSGASTGIIMPGMDTEAINIFLAEFSRRLAADVHAVLIWDGAGFHVARALEVPANVSLIRLPPYSPELNPIENLWHYFRSHFWSNRLYPTWEDLLTAAVAAMDVAMAHPELIKSVCADPYLTPERRQN